MKQCVLVNGADNFIGRYLVAALRQRDSGKVLAVDTGDAAALRAALPEAQAVAHVVVGAAAAIARNSAMLYAAIRALTATPRVVHLSSMTVYGSQSGIVDERSATPADLGGYSVAQLQAERDAARHSNTVILRSGVEYGPDCPVWSERVVRYLRARRLGDLGAAGDGICNLVYIEDLRAAILAALTHPQGGTEIFNVAARDKPTWNEYFTRFALALGAVPVKRISQRRLRVESRLLAPPLKIAEICASRLGRAGLWLPPPLPASVIAVCSQEISLSVAKAEEKLAIKWTSLSAGLDSTAAYYR
jgi:nucleoside-diphosphate-sugar epimerase